VGLHSMLSLWMQVGYRPFRVINSLTAALIALASSVK